jgi:hypothetical protein
MLAIISILVLQTEHGHVLPRSANLKKESTPTSPSNVDYFSLKKSTIPASPISVAWARIPSPKAPPHPPSVSSSNSSRASWSSLFNTGTMRQFMSGVQDTLKEGLLTPSEVPLPVTTPEIQITTVMPSDKNVRTIDSSSSRTRKKRTRNNSTFTPTSVVSQSWSVASLGHPSRRTAFPTSATGDRRSSLRFVGPSPLVHEKRVVFGPPSPPFNEL